MASSSRDVTMTEHRILEDSKRSMDKEAAENFRSRLTHQWFDPKRYPDPLARGTSKSTSSVPGVNGDMEQKWLNAITSVKARRP